MKFGRVEALGTHQFVPCPSIVPNPVMATSVRVLPLINGVEAEGQLGMMVKPFVVTLRGSI
jgi:hypothetical protein